MPHILRATIMNYEQFIATKAIVSPPSGFQPADLPLKRPLFAFQRACVRWALRRGRAALFHDCGLGKTAQQLAWANEVAHYTKGSVLILAPLAVADQTIAEGRIIGVPVKHVAVMEDVDSPICITNYEKLHKFEADRFAGVVLDESSILKSFDGKTRSDLISAFRSTRYKLACTATPAPNDYMELGNHAEFIGVMTREEMLSMFFTHDGGDTSKWRLKGHAQDVFWRWLCAWAVNLRKPSDLGFEDDGFVLPPLAVEQHIVEGEHKLDGYLFALPASTLHERRAARNGSINQRVKTTASLADHGRPVLVWCNLNNESKAAASAIDGAVEVTGSDTEEHKISAVRGFIAGTHRVLVSKPSIVGFGMNFQHCADVVFLGLSDSYEQYYQAVRRCWRFGQRRPVSCHLVISHLEGAVLANIRRKEGDAAAMSENMVRHMADISSSEVRGVNRQTTSYYPNETINLPSFINDKSMHPTDKRRELDTVSR